VHRKLNELVVSRLKEPGICWDSHLPGFGVRLGVRTKTFIVSIRRPGFKQPTRLKVGHYPAMSVAEARSRAREMMAGGAPATPKLFGDMVREFLAHGRTRSGRPVRPATLNAYKTVLEGPGRALWHRPVGDIRRREIAAVTASTARQSGTAMASLTRSTLARFWAWLGEVDDEIANPVTGTPNYAVRKRDRVLSDAEIGSLWQATEGPGDFAMIVRILLWTGCRRGEAGGLRWSELNSFSTAKVIWAIPPDRTKNGKELTLPISRQMQSALAAWPQVLGKDTLFGARSQHGFNGWGDAKGRLDAVLRFNRPFVIHDIRRSVETRLAELGVSKEIRSRVLSHDLGDLDASYQHYSFEAEKRQALQRWADCIDDLSAR
jgi:integrase